MKIAIFGERFHFKMHVPIFFIKSKIFLKAIHADISSETMRVCYKEIKRYVKQNGHFKFVDIEAANGGGRVEITI